MFHFLVFSFLDYSIIFDIYVIVIVSAESFYDHTMLPSVNASEILEMI